MHPTPQFLAGRGWLAGGDDVGDQARLAAQVLPCHDCCFTDRLMIEQYRLDPSELNPMASDFHLVGTATLPHGISFIQDDLMMASLDHGMWFHRPARVDDWLLYSCDSPSSSGGRGLARGLIYDRNGRLVASTIQEGMIRVGKRKDKKE